MTFLEAKSVEGERQNQGSKCDACSKVVDGHSALATNESHLLEILEAQFSDVASLPAITSWGFAGSDLAIETDIHTLDFTLMNAARVISTGGWSRPSVDNFAADGDAHRVTSFDRFNAIPTNGNTLQGIGDRDALIKDCHCGMDEEQVGTAQYKSSPSDGDKVTLDSAGRDRLDNQSKNNDSGNACAKPNGAWSISQNVTHLHSVILSQQSGLEGSQA